MNPWPIAKTRYWWLQASGIWVAGLFDVGLETQPGVMLCGYLENRAMWMYWENEISQKNNSGTTVHLQMQCGNPNYVYGNPNFKCNVYIYIHICVYIGLNTYRYLYIKPIIRPMIKTNLENNLTNLWITCKVSGDLESKSVDPKPRNVIPLCIIIYIHTFTLSIWLSTYLPTSLPTYLSIINISNIYIYIFYTCVY
jgi:hypothetical protein